MTQEAFILDSKNILRYLVPSINPSMTVRNEYNSRLTEAPATGSGVKQRLWIKAFEQLV